MAEYAQLVVEQGPQPGQGFMLVRALLTIGRDAGNDIVISHPEISRQHTRITRQGELVIVEDMGSTNGTFVNGVLLKSPHTLSDGDVIGMGDAVTLVYHAVEASAAKTVVERKMAPPPSAASAQPAAAAEAAPVAPEGKSKSRRWITIGCLGLIVACAALIALAFWMDANHPDILYAPLEWLGLR
ncbi:MAG: FHA domain-containing protein [Anaerolineales bacterium]|nr:MAG: FHA domain-containing protein [Anaerolineales bacterium]